MRETIIITKDYACCTGEGSYFRPGGAEPVGLDLRCSTTTQTNLKFEGGARKNRWKLPLLFLLGCVCSTVSAAVKITDLGTLGGSQSIAYAINDYDQIVGTSWLAGDTDSSDFLYTNGRMIDLAQFNFVSAEAINNSGQIAGVASGANGNYYPAMYDSQVRRGVSTIILGSLGGVTSYGFAGTSLAINNFGQAVGYSFIDDTRRHAFFYDKGIMRDISSLDDFSVAFDINDSGSVVGLSGSNGFLYQNGVIQYLIPFGSTESDARAINNSGQVVGQYLIAGHTAFHAFLYSNGVFTDIGAENSHETIAYDINEAGTVVGTTWVVPRNSCRDCEEYPHAFLYEKGVFTDLNTLLPPGSEWELIEAYAINNRGKIVGYGLIHGQWHAFLLQFVVPSAQVLRHWH